MPVRVTINDVAARAGISYQTVSRVINQHALVSDAVRERVLQAMRDLDYSPNAAARSLAGGRTRLLAVLIADVYNPFWGAVLRGIEDVAYGAGYSVITCNIGRYDAEREAIYLRVLREHRVAGVIVAGGYLREDALEPLTLSGIHVVSVDERRPGMDNVLLDNCAAAGMAVEHLVALGHRRIGIICGQLVHFSGRGRLMGYRRAVRHAGFRLERDLQAVVRYLESDALAAARQMLSRLNRPTALLAGSNDLTIGAMRAAASLGLRIPTDLALVGFDELTWTSSLLPPITTVVQPGTLIGSTACRLLLARLNGQYTGPPRRVLLPACLVASRSSAATEHLHPVDTSPEVASSLLPLPLLLDAGPGTLPYREQTASMGSTEQRKEAGQHPCV